LLSAYPRALIHQSDMATPTMLVLSLPRGQRGSPVISESTSRDLPTPLMGSIPLTGRYGFLTLAPPGRTRMLVTVSLICRSLEEADPCPCGDFFLYTGPHETLGITTAAGSSHGGQGYLAGQRLTCVLTGDRWRGLQGLWIRRLERASGPQGHKRPRGQPRR
jgi:hypothetical protein